MFERTSKENIQGDRLTGAPIAAPDGPTPCDREQARMTQSPDRPPVYYGDYLQVDKLLSCQNRESERLGRPAHDEMLFIVIHQAYELWFKQILFELDAVQAIFARDPVRDREVGRATRALERVQAILKLLVHQVDVLETMTPLDFLDFRDLLYPASGFQSAQFRQIETRLGLRRKDRLAFDRQSFDQRLSEGDRQRVAAAETRRSEEHTSELQSLMRISYAVFCLKKKKYTRSRHWKYTINSES